MINYVIKKKKNPSDQSAPEKYYLSAKTLGAIDRKDLIDTLVKNTSRTAGEAAADIDELMRSIAHFLKLGFSVKLGNWGYFRTSIHSKGTEKEKNACATKLKAVRIRFIPGKAMSNELSNVKVVKSNSSY